MNLLNRSAAAMAAAATVVTILASGNLSGSLLIDPPEAGQSRLVANTSAVDLEARLQQLRIPFVPNRGQVDERVAYYGPAPGGTLFVTHEGELTYSLRGAQGREVLTERFLDGHARPSGIEAGAARVSVFRGTDTARHAAGLGTFNALSLGEVWPGVAVELRARGASVEKLFTLTPGASTQSIALGFEGVHSLQVAASGELIAATPRGDYTFSAPIAYQESRDETQERELIGVRYVVDGLRYGFVLDEYDRERPVVIDPTLTYATFLGGATNDDTARAAAIDAAGSLYIVGETASTDFPVTPGAPDSTHLPADCFDVFVAKLDPTGAALEYATFLGSTGCDAVIAIAVDGVGAAYIAGSAGAGFPTTLGAAQIFHGGNGDAFITKLSAAGDALLYSTYLGGDQVELDHELDAAFAIDADGHAYLYGTTGSTDFPTSAGAPQTTRGDPMSGESDRDAFITKLSPDGSQFLFSTYHGGSGDEVSGGDVSSGAAAASMAVGTGGIVYVTGQTYSDDLPVTASAQQQIFGGGQADAFLAIFDTEAGTRTYSSWLGGSGTDLGSSIALQGADAVIVAGETSSADLPVAADAFDTSLNGATDLFVARFDLASSTVSQLTYLGGGIEEYEPQVRVKADGRVVLGGSTRSSDFPITAGAMDSSLGGTSDGFIAQFAPTLQTLEWATFLGGDDFDGLYLLEVDAAGNVYGVGNTLDPALPVTTGGLSHGGGDSFDDYLVKLDAAGTQVLDATYLGGIGSEVAYFMVVDDTTEVVYLGGETESPDFPATTGAFDTSYGDDGDAYIARFTTTPASTPPAPPAQPGVVQFGAAAYSANENGGSVTLTLTRTNGADGAIGVSVASGGGPAAAGTDYTALSQTVSWSDGDVAAKTVELAILDDAADEPDETVSITLSNATGGASIGAQSSTTVTIVDDDATPAPPAPSPPAGGTQGSSGGGSMGWTSVLALALLAALRVRMVSGGRDGKTRSGSPPLCRACFASAFTTSAPNCTNRLQLRSCYPPDGRTTHSISTSNSRRQISAARKIAWPDGRS